MPIAFQGAPGAYSHLAAEALFPGEPTLPLSTFDDVFDAVTSGTAARGVIPVENSQAGRVAEIHRLLGDCEGLSLLAEHYQPVAHRLLGVPGARLAQITEAWSHPQALAQCHGWLRAHGIRPVAANDTAGAAALIAADKNPERAAIASALAGDLYGLTPLADGLADDPTNTTRFLVLAREAPIPPLTSGPWTTTLRFGVRHLPAALYKALGGFATNGVNLLKIESWQQASTFAWTRFLIDLDGHPDDPAVARALAELDWFSTERRILGVYPKKSR